MTVLPTATHGMAKPTRAGRDTSAGKSMLGLIGEALVKQNLRTWERNGLVTFVGDIGYAVEFKVKTVDGPVGIKLMWQASSGTAEMKYPWHLLHLAKALEERNIVRAYLVLGGEGFTRKQQFIRGDFVPRILGAERVEVMDLPVFLGYIANGRL